MKTIPPGSTLGILGGGQLGRMTALAAARLGYRCHVFCPSADEPAVEVCAMHTQGAFTDKVALEVFAATVDVITLEWENLPLECLEFLAARKPVFPDARALRVAQDRVLEKTFAQENGVGTAAFVVVNSAEELAEALKHFSRPCILKSTRMGYDGKGQVRIDDDMTAATAWKSLGSNAGILEDYVPFAREISVIVARRADGAMAAYPAVENIHRDHILAETKAPADIAPDIAYEAEQLARRFAEKLEIVGLLAVEMFVLKEPNAAGQRVLMNEIAPRPHNSGHWTMDACGCDQFEQLVRAICGLPLGSPAPHSRAIMTNLLGDDIRHWLAFLQTPNAHLHLYGKAEARKGRKMGHVTIVSEPIPKKN